MECTTKADEWEATFDHRTLNFVVSTRSSMKDTVKVRSPFVMSTNGHKYDIIGVQRDNLAIILRAIGEIFLGLVAPTDVEKESRCK